MGHCVLALWDGTVEPLFKFRDFTDLVDFYMGHEATRWLDNYVEGLQEVADYTAVKVDTDLSSYEANLESNQRAFEELQDILKEVHGLIAARRVDKHAVEQALIRGSSIIKNQI